MRKRMAVALLAACLGLTGSAGVASAATTPQMTGHWAGFFHSIGNPDLRGGLTLDVTSQRGNRFSGDLRGLSPTGGSIPVVGTISGSGDMTMRSSTGTNFDATGSFERSPGSDTGTFEGRYRIRYPSGTHDEGNVVVAHLVPDSAAPSFAGSWSGSGTDSDGLAAPWETVQSDPYCDDGDGNNDLPFDPVPVDVAASLIQDRLGAIGGRITLGAAGAPAPRTFDLAGQAFGGDGASNNGLVLVGSSDRALIAIQLNFPPSPGGPHLEGSYLMINDNGRPACESGSITLAPSDGEVGAAP
jgi:hypothetical protein